MSRFCTGLWPTRRTTLDSAWTNVTAGFRTKPDGPSDALGVYCSYRYGVICSPRKGVVRTIADVSDNRRAPTQPIETDDGGPSRTNRMHIAELTLFAWVPVVLFLFSVLPPRHAVVTAFVGGWLFLPVFSIDLPGLPPFSKVSASAYAVMFSAVLFDADRLLTFRPKWFDLPIAVWCCAPLFASLSNGLGWYDGLSACLSEAVMWGIPYVLGRVYFNDWEGIRELAIGVFLGGVIYVPLCLLEMRLSPQLHRWVYGYFQHSFGQQKREGGYRPMVFMQHGIACAMWMTTCTIVGIWLWATGAVKRIYGMPIYALAIPLLLTTIMCKSAGALVLLLAGLGTFFWVRTFRNALPLLVLILFIPTYVYLRASATWSGQNLVDTARQIFGDDRAASLQTRLDAENLLTEKALQQPAFGYGRWNRNRVYDEKGRDIAVTDGLWVIVLGQAGVTGLASVTTAILLPSLLYWWRCPPRWWMHPMAAAGASFAVLLPLHMCDNLWNAMLNPVYVLVIGGLGGLGAGMRRVRTQSQPQGFAVVPRPMVARPAVAIMQ